MPEYKRVFNFPDTGARIHVTPQAQNIIGFRNVDEFVRLLNNMMGALGAQKAYVSKSGFAVEIHLIRSNGWKGTLKLKKGGGRE